MRFEVRHLTRYTYGTSVFLGPQTLRLKPLTNANQRLLSFDLDVTPAPALVSALVDLEGNDSAIIWQEGRTDHLIIETVSTVETLRSNPFDFLWQGADHLPLTYDGALEPGLARYRGPGGEQARELGERVAKSPAVEESAQVFPYRLAAVLNESLSTIVRPEGHPLAPEETLNAGEGSCRDLAVLFIAVCREMGYAARFVSGYHATEADEHELHAWAELYLPGGGWRGFDPTIGLATADSHITVATGAQAAQAAPISGSFRGRGASTLETSVVVRRLAD